MTLAAAGAPRAATDVRILVVEGSAMTVVSSSDFATLFRPGDLLVVNDAATVPASLYGTTASGEPIELRLLGAIGDTTWNAALLGAGDHRTRTEDRPPPPPVALGDRLTLRSGLVMKYHEARPPEGRSGLVAVVARVAAASSRLLTIDLQHDPGGVAEVWAALYAAGRPVQYAHVPAPLALWDVQNVYAGRPWAVEMPSAGRALRFRTLLELRRRGIEIARVTHAAGISATGDPAIDRLLPLPERYEVRSETWDAIERARRSGGRVVAIGTSVVRALEGGVRAGRTSGITDLRIGPHTRRAIVDAVLTGVHEPDTTHFALLGAFASKETLARIDARAVADGLLGHELGDGCLIWGAPRLGTSSGKPIPRPRGEREKVGTRSMPQRDGW